MTGRSKAKKHASTISQVKILRKKFPKFFRLLKRYLKLKAKKLRKPKISSTKFVKKKHEVEVSSHPTPATLVISEPKSEKKIEKPPFELSKRESPRCSRFHEDEDVKFTSNVAKDLSRPKEEPVGITDAEIEEIKLRQDFNEDEDVKFAFNVAKDLSRTKEKTAYIPSAEIEETKTKTQEPYEARETTSNLAKEYKLLSSSISTEEKDYHFPAGKLDKPKQKKKQRDVKHKNGKPKKKIKKTTSVPKRVLEKTKKRRPSSTNTKKSKIKPKVKETYLPSIDIYEKESKIQGKDKAPETLSSLGKEYDILPSADEESHFLFTKGLEKSKYKETQVPPESLKQTNGEKYRKTSVVSKSAPDYMKKSKPKESEERKKIIIKPKIKKSPKKKLILNIAAADKVKSHADLSKRQEAVPPSIYLTKTKEKPKITKFIDVKHDLPLMHDLKKNATKVVEQFKSTLLLQMNCLNIPAAIMDSVMYSFNNEADKWKNNIFLLIEQMNRKITLERDINKKALHDLVTLNSTAANDIQDAQKNILLYLKDLKDNTISHVEDFKKELSSELAKVRHEAELELGDIKEHGQNMEQLEKQILQRLNEDAEIGLQDLKDFIKALKKAAKTGDYTRIQYFPLQRSSISESDEIEEESSVSEEIEEESEILDEIKEESKELEKVKAENEELEEVKEESEELEKIKEEESEEMKKSEEEMLNWKDKEKIEEMWNWEDRKVQSDEKDMNKDELVENDTTNRNISQEEMKKDNGDREEMQKYILDKQEGIKIDNAETTEPKIQIPDEDKINTYHAEEEDIEKSKEDTVNMLYQETERSDAQNNEETYENIPNPKEEKDYTAVDTKQWKEETKPRTHQYVIGDDIIVTDIVYDDVVDVHEDDLEKSLSNSETKDVSNNVRNNNVKKQQSESTPVKSKCIIF